MCRELFVKSLLVRTMTWEVFLALSLLNLPSYKRKKVFLREQPEKSKVFSLNLTVSNALKPSSFLKMVMNNS